MACSNCNKTNILQTATNIATGLMNTISKRPEVEAIAAPRIKICSECSFVRELVKVGNKSIYQCGSTCKCLIELKTRVKEETCPEGKW